MTGSKKASLQRRFADTGISTEGTKKDLTARLKTSKSVSVVGAIIYNEPFGLPETGKGSKAYYCGQEIGPIWYFSSELLKLGTTERHAKEILDRLAAIKAEAQKWRST